MNTLLKIKNIVYTVIIAVIFVLPIQGQDLKTTLGKMYESYDAKRYGEAVTLATQALPLTNKLQQAYGIRAMRALAISSGYLTENWRLSSSEFAYKYDAATVEKIRTGIDDCLFALNYIESNPSGAIKETKSQLVFNLGLFYVYLADRATHDRADYANAEKHLSLAASLGVASGKPSAFLPRVFAAQGKFDAARREALRKLAVSKTYDVEARLMVTDFDFVGELYLGEAVLLSEASQLKATGKPLTDLGEAMERHQTNLKDIAKFTNPTTTLELNRQGALLFMMKQPEKAAAVLECAAQMGNNATALRWLTLVRLQQQNYPAAETLAAKILAANPTDIIGLTARGLIAATKNNFAQAEKDLTQAIDAFPEAALFANTYKILALVYQKRNDTLQLGVTLEKQKRLEALYQEMRSAKPKSFSEQMLDKRPND